MGFRRLLILCCGSAHNWARRSNFFTISRHTIRIASLLHNLSRRLSPNLTAQSVQHIFISGRVETGGSISASTKERGRPSKSCLKAEAAQQRLLSQSKGRSKPQLSGMWPGCGKAQSHRGSGQYLFSSCPRSNTFC